jgi:hypothetical protein
VPKPQPLTTEPVARRSICCPGPEGIAPFVHPAISGRTHRPGQLPVAYSKGALVAGAAGGQTTSAVAHGAGPPADLARVITVGAVPAWQRF